jgi:hypothetical protein
MGCMGLLLNKDFLRLLRRMVQLDLYKHKDYKGLCLRMDCKEHKGLRLRMDCKEHKG